MAYGSPLTSTLPTVSVTAGPAYATSINAFLTELQGIVEAKVTPAGMDMNADLSMLSGGTYSRLKDALAVGFKNQSAALSAVTYPTHLYTTGTDGNLYFNDGAGRQIQMTSAGAVNASTTGGITGSGYGAGGVEVNWDSGNAQYIFYTNSATPTYADVTCDDLKLSDGSSNFVSVVAPAGMSVDYTLTLPSAVPAGTSLVQMTAAGALQTTLTPSVTTVTTTGLITAGGGVTASANQNITISGNGRYLHGNISRIFPGSMAVYETDLGSAPDISRTGTFGHPKWNMSHSMFIPLSFDVDDGVRLKQIDIYKYHGATVGTRTFRLCRTDVATDTVEVLAYDAISTTSAVVTATLELGSLGGGSTTLNLEIVSGYDYWLEITGESGDYLKYAEVVYDRIP